MKFLLRLCLVHVKAFPERKMFSCVWLHFQKFSKKYFLVFGKEEGKDKPRKTWTKPSLTLDAWLGSTAQCFVSSSPTTAPWIAISRSTAPLREIAIGGAISRSDAPIEISDRDWRHWCLRTERTGGRCVWTVRTGACERHWCVRASPSRSLSLSLRNSFEVKIGTEIHLRSQSLFFSVNGNQFPKNSIFQTNQTSAFPEMIFTQNKHSLKLSKYSYIFSHLF